MNNNNNNDQLIKRGFKRRLRPCRVPDPNNSMINFRRFYQSGGRDVEQYRLWLQALSKSEQSSTSSSIDLNKIKDEPMDIRSDVVAILPSSSAPLIVHSQQPLSSLRVARTHSLVKPIRHLSLPIKSQVSLPFSTLSSSLITAPSSLERQTHLTCDCSNIPTVPIPSSSSSLFNWSVADVGRFIEKHFPEKNLARKFIQQKIDGRTLPLLTEDHLTRILKMKLGPALHLLSLISDIRIQN